MFIALSQFTVMPGMGDEVLNAFLSRPHLVDNAPGYKKMEVLRPQNNPDEFWLMTWWEDERSYSDWHHSHAYRESHNLMPKGLKLVSGTSKVTFLEKVCE